MNPRPRRTPLVNDRGSFPNLTPAMHVHGAIRVANGSDDYGDRRYRFAILNPTTQEALHRIERDTNIKITGNHTPHGF